MFIPGVNFPSPAHKRSGGEGERKRDIQVDPFHTPNLIFVSESERKFSPYHSVLMYSVCMWKKEEIPEHTSLLLLRDETQGLITAHYVLALCTLSLLMFPRLLTFTFSLREKFRKKENFLGFFFFLISANTLVALGKQNHAFKTSEGKKRQHIHISRLPSSLENSAGRNSGWRASDL